MALDKSPAATDESTPPDNASKTFPSPTLLRISSIDSFTNESILHVPAHPHTSRTKL